MVIAPGGEVPGTFEEVEALFRVGSTDRYRWMTLPDLPTPRHGLGVVSIGDAVYTLHGGPDAGLAFSGVVERIRIKPPGRLRCGSFATEVGTPGPNSFEGGPGRDVVLGLGGNDSISGGPGGDRLCGGPGRDRLIGGPGGTGWSVGRAGTRVSDRHVAAWRARKTDPEIARPGYGRTTAAPSPRAWVRISPGADPAVPNSPNGLWTDMDT